MNGIFPQKQRNKLTKLGVSQQSGLLRNDGRFVRGFFPFLVLVVGLFSPGILRFCPPHCHGLTARREVR